MLILLLYKTKNSKITIFKRVFSFVSRILIADVLICFEFDENIFTHLPVNVGELVVEGVLLHEQTVQAVSEELSPDRGLISMESGVSVRNLFLYIKSPSPHFLHRNEEAISTHLYVVCMQTDNLLLGKQVTIYNGAFILMNPLAQAAPTHLQPSPGHSRMENHSLEL